jgi:hypothetical protein
MPFTRIVFCCGEPLRVPRKATDEELESLREEAERRMKAATREAEAALEEESLWKA